MEARFGACAVAVMTVAAPEVRHIADQLGTLVTGLGYADEARLLADFDSRSTNKKLLDAVVSRA